MKPTIVLVDDEPMMQLLLKQVFKKDFDVHVFNNGKEALNFMYAGVIPDIVVVDLQMPEMNGYELIKHFKSSGYFQNVPVMVLSAEETSSDRIKCFELGAVDYMIKPFNPKELQLRVQKILSITK